MDHEKKEDGSVEPREVAENQEPETCHVQGLERETEKGVLGIIESSHANEVGTLSAEQKAAVEAAFTEDADPWKYHNLMQSINSIPEIDAVLAYAEEKGLKLPQRLFPGFHDIYRERIADRPDPESDLPENFRKKFPLLSAKLNSPQAVRLLFTLDRICSLEDIAPVLEKLIQSHEKDGFNRITVYPKTHQEAAAVARFGDSLQVIALKRFLFPDFASCENNFREPNIIFQFGGENPELAWRQLPSVFDAEI